MRTLLSVCFALTISPALAFGCWEPLSEEPTILGHVSVGEEEIWAGDFAVCEMGSVEGSTYRADCISDAGEIAYIQVTENGDTATVSWNEGEPEAYRRCD